MAVLFNKDKNKYVELKLFSINDSEWITYKMYGGKICDGKNIALFKLDNSALFFHNSYEKEVDTLINGLKNIKTSNHYVFTPKDEGEFLLEATYEDDMIFINFSFYVIDKIKKDELQENMFEIVTTYSVLCDFLTQLKREYFY